MHIICDECFNKAGPLEELNIWTLLVDLKKCAYCEKESPANTSHRLAGDTPRFDVCWKLGVSTKNCSYFEHSSQQRDLDDAFECELVKDSHKMAVEAIEYLRNNKKDIDARGGKRLGRLIEVLLGH